MLGSAVQAILCAILCFTLLPSYAAADSGQLPKCLADIRSGKFGDDGITDNNGNPTTNFSNATAITYEKCLEACGAGGHIVAEWSSFSQQLSAWLLPWLALLSQFPFGCRRRWDNLMSICLTFGSPCLAAYSLILTVLNIRWVVRRFSHISYPNKDWAAAVLLSLQHMPLHVRRTVTVDKGDYPLLASLIVLPENNRWWERLEKNLNYADLNTWSIASVSSIAWGIITYALTMVDAFTSISSDVNNNGLGTSGVGSLWLWMIPVIAGYLQLSPRCDLKRVEEVLNDANQLCVVAGPNGVTHASIAIGASAITVQECTEHRTLHADHLATAPVYNYVRIFSFVKVVEAIACAFEAASEQVQKQRTVSGIDWVPLTGGVHEGNRRGTSEQVEQYCSPRSALKRRSHWESGSGVISRFFIAAVAGLTLQWSTIGGSIIIGFYTPTVGLGCRSAAYLLYAVVATLVWVLLVTSGFLAHFAVPHAFRRQRTSHKAAERISIFLRRAAKVLATLNTLWIVLVLLLQFSGFLNRCYCNSDVIGLGKRAYNVMRLLPSDIPGMKAAWMAGILLAVISTVAWWIFLVLIFTPPPRPHRTMTEQQSIDAGRFRIKTEICT
ncbi:hypothetical protein MIND_00156500 [Mycena indigotica]|uniref:Uncharacterized protein n=1 Tax=Mycena indigotica TaxID=2126181 RepID=A0A8H6TGN1_9AGAR|nr:uncharacterized protein MIND_00156500 [Mycena indigotica]KAF7316377.1 hypothetical protein MIND_00156500 [Mycena indigotica]